MSSEIKEMDFDKLTFISENKVPPMQRKTVWNTAFSKLPEGKAYVIEDKNLTMSARNALKRFQERGLFTNFVVKQIDYVGYIIHKKKENKI